MWIEEHSSGSVVDPKRRATLGRSKDFEIFIILGHNHVKDAFPVPNTTLYLILNLKVIYTNIKMLLTKRPNNLFTCVMEGMK